MLKVLLVDDDPAMIEVSRIILEKEGFEVISANDKDNGLRMAEEERPDIMVLDVMMKELDDGIVMVRELRARGVQTPIIMLTGLGKATCMKFVNTDDQLQVNEYFEKPVEPQKLIDAIKKWSTRREE